MHSPFQGLSITEGNPLPCNADEAIEDFISNFNLDEAHLYLSQLANCALTESEELFEQRMDRSNILFFCEQAWYTLQAVHMLYKSQPQTAEPASSTNKH